MVLHMADALISPAVGGAMWAASAGLMAYSSRKVEKNLDERKVPLMGVLGAFIFAAQMINFTIPLTGSSGHLGGGLILAALLGPYAGFITMASILTVQALFFADGGLMALGCNIFNLGFFPCFIAYPLIFKAIVAEKWSPPRIIWGSILAAVVGLQMGSFGVVLQTGLSGITELSIGEFLLLMQPIHLAIGLVEGVITALVVSFVWKARPEILERTTERMGWRMGHVLLTLAIAAAFMGGILSWYASSHPDGLEWALSRTTGQEELETPHGFHQTLAELQERIAFMPDYGFPQVEKVDGGDLHDSGGENSRIDGGTSTAGLVGGAMTLVLVGIIGWILHQLKKRAKLNA